MIKLNTNSTTLIYSDAADFGPGPVRRLMVLIPPAFDYTLAMSRISDLAATLHARVLMLGLCKDAADELSLRRELVTLSALLHNTGVCTETTVEIRRNWVDVVKTHYRAGDLIVCFAEQQVGLFQQPLSQVLASDVGVPVYIPSPLHAQSQAPSNWLSKIILWTGLVGIVAGTFLLQIQITSVLRDWAQTILLIISVFMELWLIWIWNSLFN